MAEKKDFPQGLIAKSGNVDFVKAKLSFKVDEFVNALKENEKKGWVNIDILESKAGKLYAKYNDFEPQKETQSNEQIATTDDSLPF